VRAWLRPLALTLALGTYAGRQQEGAVGGGGRVAPALLLLLLEVAVAGPPRPPRASGACQDVRDPAPSRDRWWGAAA